MKMLKYRKNSIHLYTNEDKDMQLITTTKKTVTDLQIWQLILQPFY